MIPIARPEMTTGEKQKVMEVMESGMLASGGYVEEFEDKFSTYIGTKYGIATSSGTTALDTVLKTLGVGKGDKVLTTPFSFIASSNSILYNGAQPVFVDVDPGTFNIDPGEMARKLEEEPDIKALLIVHLYGLSCDMEPIMELVEKYDLLLIEDCAQAHGAEYNGQKVGTFGDAAVFSFYPTKNMTTGEGGMVLTDNEGVAEQSRLLINHGQGKRYYHQQLGYNYRLTNIAAAIGLIQLEKLDTNNNTRRENASFLSENFGNLKFLDLPHIPENRLHVFHQYTIKIEERDRFAEYLEESGIGYGIHYPLPIYKQPVYKKLGYDNIRLQEVEKLAKRVLSLPVHPSLSGQELKEIVKVVSEFEKLR